MYRIRGKRHYGLEDAIYLHWCGEKEGAFQLLTQVIMDEVKDDYVEDEHTQEAATCRTTKTGREAGYYGNGYSRKQFGFRQ